jgi:16S rRNA U516 pseudouridylate synthase RsuA-like enzyme
MNSEGLLLLTNDGELSRALETAADRLVRRYRARARGDTTQEKLDTLKNGITVEGVTLRRDRGQAGQGQGQGRRRRPTSGSRSRSPRARTARSAGCWKRWA